MPQRHQDCQLHSSNSSQHQYPNIIAKQKNHKSNKTTSFTNPNSMKGHTFCQDKNATEALRLSASFIQLQPASVDLPPVKARIPQGHQDCQFHNSRQHERTYHLSRQECHKGIKTVSFIHPTPASINILTSSQSKKTTKATRLPVSQIQTA